MANIKSSLTLRQVCDVYQYVMKKKPACGVNTWKEDQTQYDVAVFEKEPSAKIGTPIKFQCFALFLCLDGELIRYVNQYKYPISKGVVQIVPPESIYFFETQTEVSEAKVLFFNEIFLKSEENKHVTKSIEALIAYHHNNFQPVHLSAEGFTQIKYILNEIEQELNTKQSDYREIVTLLIIKLLFLLKRQKEHQKIPAQSMFPQALKTANDYLDLVEKHYLEYSQVNDYAKLLKITPKYLGEILKSAFGQNALFFIHNRKLKEALYLLRSSKYSISEISKHLGFASQSDFNRFFKKYYYATPKQFRDSVK